MKRISALTIVLLLSFWVVYFAFPVMAAPRTFYVSDYGAMGDGITDDTAAISNAIHAAGQAGPGSTVRLAARRYRVSAPANDGVSQYCINVTRANGVTIQGVTGLTEVVSSSFKAGLFLFTQCTNVQVRGLILDYDPVPFIQGSIIAVDPLQGTYDVQVDEGYLTFDTPSMTNILWGVVMERSTRRFKPGTPSVLGFKAWTPLGNRTWRLKLTTLAHVQTIAPGDAFAMRAVKGGCALIFSACQGAVVEQVSIYAAASAALIFVQCEGDLVVRRVDVRPRPGTTRLLSSNADGIHCQALRKGPLVEECHFSGMTDDGMNTYARTLAVTKVVSPTALRVQDSREMRVGDRVQVLDPHLGLVRGEATVVALVRKQRITLDKPILNVRTSTNILQGTTEPNQLDADVIYNLSSCGAGYIIRNNYFGDFRGRGVLLRGVNGLVESNIFERTSGPGIVIANEPKWPEGPVPRKVVIRGNELRSVALGLHDVYQAAIVVTADGLKGNPPYAAGVRDIHIVDNRIVSPPSQGIFLRSCANVSLCNNQIEADATRAIPSSSVGLNLTTCSNVTVSGFTMNYTRPNTRCGIRIGASVAPGEAGIRISGSKAYFVPAVQMVLDQRGRGHRQ